MMHPPAPGQFAGQAATTRAAAEIQAVRKNGGGGARRVALDAVTIKFCAAARLGMLPTEWNESPQPEAAVPANRDVGPLRPAASGRCGGPACVPMARVNVHLLRWNTRLLSTVRRKVRSRTLSSLRGTRTANKPVKSPRFRESFCPNMGRPCAQAIQTWSRVSCGLSATTTKRTSRSYSSSADALRATRRSAWFDLPPGGRASAGTVGRVEVLGHNAFVSLGDGGDE